MEPTAGVPLSTLDFYPLPATTSNYQQLPDCYRCNPLIPDLGIVVTVIRWRIHCDSSGTTAVL